MSKLKVFVGVLNPPSQPVPPPIAEWITASDLVGQWQHGFSFFLTDLDFELKRFHENSISLISYGRELLKGEVGAALAHQAAYRAFLGSEFEWAVILEDDVNFATQAVDSDLGLFLTEVSQETQFPTVVLLGDSMPKSMSSRVRSQPLRKICFIPTGAFAYLINRPAANLLLAKSGKVKFQADWPLGARNVSFFVPETSIVEHPTGNLSRVDLYSQKERRFSNSRNFALRALRIRNLEDLAAWWHLTLLRGVCLWLIKVKIESPLRTLRSWDNNA